MEATQVPSTHPKTVAIIGYGSLGRATLNLVASQLAGRLTRKAFKAIKFDVYDPAFGKELVKYPVLVGVDYKKGKRRNGAQANVEWFETYGELADLLHDVVIVCVPTNRLEEVLQTTPPFLRQNQCLIVRTTAHADTLPKYASHLKNGPLAYVPEYGTEDDLEQNLCYINGFYTNSVYSAGLISQLFGADLMREASYEKVALDKLLNNALLATLYNFNNERAMLYRHFGVDQPKELVAAKSAREILQRPLNRTPLIFGGKCMDLALKSLEDEMTNMGHGSMFEQLRRVNTDRMMDYEQVVGEYIDKLLKRTRRTDGTCYILGEGSHVDAPYLKTGRTAANGVLDHSSMLSFDEQVRLETIGGLKRKPMPHVWVIQPMTNADLLAALQGVIARNKALRKNYLTVFDTCGQINQSAQALLKTVATADGKTFDLRIVSLRQLHDNQAQ